MKKLGGFSILWRCAILTEHRNGGDAMANFGKYYIAVSPLPIHKGAVARNRYFVKQNRDALTGVPAAGMLFSACSIYEIKRPLLSNVQVLPSITWVPVAITPLLNK